MDETLPEARARNEAKKELYQIFAGRVETDIIDMVLAGCGYDMEKSIDNILSMLGDDTGIKQKEKEQKKGNTRISQEPTGSQLSKQPVNAAYRFPGDPRMNGRQDPLILMTRPSHVPYMPLSFPFQPRMQWADPRAFHFRPRGQPNRHSGIAMEKALILMRGLPGSGKSTMARSLRGTRGVILSTDDFFEQNGEYHFDPVRLGEAHEWNQFRAKRAMEDGRSPVIIDNTNIQLWEMKAYVSQALMFGYQVKFVESVTPWAWDPKELARRNSHGVPQESIQRMLDRYERNASVNRVLGALVPEKRDKLAVGPSCSQGETRWQRTRHHQSDTDLRERGRVVPTETNQGRSPVHQFSSRNDAQREADSYWSERRQLSDGSGSHGRRSPEPYDSFVSRYSDRNALEANMDMITIDDDDGETDRPRVLPQRVGRRARNGRNCSEGVTINNEQGQEVIDITDVDELVDENLDDIIDEIDRRYAELPENQTIQSDPDRTVENRDSSIFCAGQVDGLSLAEKDSKQSDDKTSEYGPAITGSGEDVLRKDLNKNEACKKTDLVIGSDKDGSRNQDLENKLKPTSPLETAHTDEEIYSNGKETKIDDSNNVGDISHIAPLKNPDVNLLTGGSCNETETTDGRKERNSEHSDNCVEIGSISRRGSSKVLMAEVLGDLTNSSGMDIIEVDSLTSATVSEGQSVVHLHETLNYEPRMDEIRSPEMAVLDCLDSSFSPVFVPEESSASIAVTSELPENPNGRLLNSSESHNGTFSNSSPGTGPSGGSEVSSVSRSAILSAATQLTGPGDTAVSVSDEGYDLDGDLKFLYECFSDLSQERIREEFVKSGKDVAKTCDALLVTNVISLSDEEDTDWDEATEEEERLSTMTVSSDGTPSPLALTDPAIVRHSSAYEVVTPIADTPFKVLSPVLRSSSPAKDGVGRDEILQLIRENITDVGDSMDVLSQNAKFTSTGADATERRDGEMFVCEKEEATPRSDGLHVALDYRLAKVLKGQYGGEDRFDLDELEPDDFIVFLEKKFCQKLYRKWNHARLARKRSLQEMVKFDEEYAKKLQLEEDSNQRPLTCEIDGAGTSKSGPFSLLRIPKRKRAAPVATDLPLPGPTLDTQPWTKVVAGVKEIDESEKLQKRLHLHQLFPAVDPRALDDVLAANSYNLNVTANLVRASFEMLTQRSLEAVSNAAPSQRKQASMEVANKASPAVVGKASANAKDAPLPGMFQTLTEPSYHDFRAEAQMHSELRAEYFRKAAKAHGEKQGELAAYYAQLGRDHNDKMKEAHARAAASILESRNENLDRQSVLDLHGLHVDEALEAMEGFLYEAEHNTKQLYVEIITGRGSHSKGGIARLKPIVMKRLIKLNYRFEPINQGSLRVWLR